MHFKKYNLFVFGGLALIVSCTDACFMRDGSTINGSSLRRVIESEEDMTINGSLTVAKITAKNLIVNGSAKIGPQKSLINELLINGSLTAENLEVKGDATVNGTAHIKSSSFGQDLTVNGALELEKSSIEGNLFISKKVTLKSGMTIKGFVEFTKEPGVVLIRGKDIHILGGIINGAVQEQTAAPKAEPVHF